MSGVALSTKEERALVSLRQQAPDMPCKNRRQGLAYLSILAPCRHTCVLAACRLADLDQVLSLLSKWLGTAEATWGAVKAAAEEKQPARMRK